MGTTAEKLQNIINAKADIGAAITEKGGTVPPKLIDYGKAIRALPAGGSPADELWGAPADPEKVYAATRPADWMPMPEPAPLELYFLFEIPAGGSAPIALTSKTKDETYEVSVGHVTDGAYVPKNTFAVATGVNWEAELAAADYPEFPVGDSAVQVMIRMKFVSSCYQTSVVSHPNAGKSTFNILEIRGDMDSKGHLLPVGTNVGSALQKLRYFDVINQNSSTTGSSVILTAASYFAHCTGLICVKNVGQPGNSVLGAYFNGCTSLIAYPVDTLFIGDDATTTNKNSAGTRMFLGCSSLTGIGEKTLNGFRNFIEAFRDCTSLTRLKGLNLSWATNISRMTEGCLNLISVEDIVLGNNRGAPTKIEPIFRGLPSLQRFTFAPMTEAWVNAFSFNISNCAFSREGLVECFSSLPTLAAGKTASITVYGNPGTADLTAADIAIATAKGWTVVTTEPATTAEEGS